MADWFRAGNFGNAAKFDGMHEVWFRTYFRAPIIKEIEIRSFFHDPKFLGDSRLRSMYVHLKASPFSLIEVSTEVKKSFSQSDFRCISIDSPDKLNKLLDLLHYFNKKYEYEYFSKNIFSEITQIFNITYNEGKYDKDKIKKYHHIIPEWAFITPHVNPLRKSSTALIELMDVFESQFRTLDHDLSKYLYHKKNPKKVEIINRGIQQLQENYTRGLAKLLSQGEDVNQFDINGVTPLSHIVLLEKNNFYLDRVKLMLCYGADPFEYNRSEMYWWSPIEYVNTMNRFEELGLIIEACIKTERPLKTNLKVVATSLSYNKPQVITKLHFSNNTTIITTIERLTNLDETRKKAVYFLYSKFFQIESETSEQDTKKKFINEFSDKNKLIELIYAGEKLIGFNLSKIIFSEIRDHTLSFNCDYALIIPEYRGYDLGQFFSFRPAYSLQLLLANYVIGIYFTAIHCASYKVIKDFLHFPKYQPDYMDALIKEILNKIYNGDYEYFHQLLNCYVVEPVRVKAGFKVNIDTDLVQYFFYKHILGLQNSNAKNNRAAPILFFISDENFHKLARIAGHLGINFAEHITELARCLFPIFSELFRERIEVMPVKIYSAALKKGNVLFWNQESIPINDVNANEKVSRKESNLNRQIANY